MDARIAKLFTPNASHVAAATVRPMQQASASKAVGAPSLQQVFARLAQPQKISPAA